jgi:hypothetical protein
MLLTSPQNETVNEFIPVYGDKQKILQCVKCTYGTFYNKTREKYLCVSYYVPNSFQSFKSCSIDILVDHIRKQVYKLNTHYFCVEILANTQYSHHHDTNNRIFLCIFTIWKVFYTRRLIVAFWQDIPKWIL